MKMKQKLLRNDLQEEKNKKGTRGNKDMEQRLEVSRAVG